jgi:hypothetical protein
MITEILSPLIILIPLMYLFKKKLISVDNECIYSDNYVNLWSSDEDSFELKTFNNSMESSDSFISINTDGSD